MDLLLTVRRTDGSLEHQRTTVETVNDGIEIVKEVFFEDGTLEVTDYKIVVVMQEGRWPVHPVDGPVEADPAETGEVRTEGAQSQMVLSHQIAQALLAHPNLPFRMWATYGPYNLTVRKSYSLEQLKQAERIARNEDEGSYMKRQQKELLAMDPVDCIILNGGLV